MARVGARAQGGYSLVITSRSGDGSRLPTERVTQADVIWGQSTPRKLRTCIMNPTYVVSNVPPEIARVAGPSSAALAPSPLPAASCVALPLHNRPCLVAPFRDYLGSA